MTVRPSFLPLSTPPEGSRLRNAYTLATLAVIAMTAPPAARAELRLPHVLSDHAVLQRERPIHVWGWATPGSHIKVGFHLQTVLADADVLGHWSLWLAPEPAGGPYNLTLTGDGEKTISDLLVGDVYLASGQSNMEIPLNGFPGNAVIKDAEKEIAAADNPKLRLLFIPHASSDHPLDDTPATWTACTPETAAKFSAVAYFFGREIASREDVPVGLIDSSWGGTPADSWVSMNTLGADPRLQSAFANRATFADKLTDLQATIAAEKAEDAAAKSAGKLAPAHFWHPESAPWTPAYLYNGMIAPFTPLSIKGFLWYQGEANSARDRARYYYTLFPALIADWRDHFDQGDLPFLFVQISSFHSPGEDWGMVRDAQRRALSVTNTAMAVTLDVGLAGNVHPPDKQTVAHRLALSARALIYREDIPHTSPLFRQATPELDASGKPELRVWFDHAEHLTGGGQPITGFELAGADHHFLPAQARIAGDTVVVSAATLSHPVYVRYNWSSDVEGNLFNAAGLPASTFTSENDPR